MLHCYVLFGTRLLVECKNQKIRCRHLRMQRREVCLSQMHVYTNCFHFMDLNEKISRHGIFVFLTQTFLLPYHTIVP